MNCLQGFLTEISRDRHFKYCIDSETVRICMPKKGSLLKFHNGQYKFKVPYIMYTDFEATQAPLTPNPEVPYTERINKHIPSGFCVNGKFAYGKVENPLKVYRGEDCVEAFCDYISNEARRLYHMFSEKLMKHVTPEKWRKHNRATTCHICFKEFKVGQRSMPLYWEISRTCS